MTAQVSESLKYEGKAYGMCTEPLGNYFTMGGKDPGFTMIDTSCWRGYVGEWEIVDNRLYMIGLEGLLEDGSEVGMEAVFPDFPDRVFAHWYSGTVRLPQGEMLRYVHMGYESQYDRDLLLTFEKGVLVGTETRKNDRPDPDQGC